MFEAPPLDDDGVAVVDGSVDENIAAGAKVDALLRRLRGDGLGRVPSSGGNKVKAVVFSHIANGAATKGGSRAAR